MKVLIIEDDENKSTQIITFLNERFPYLELVAAESLQSGLRSIIASRFDLVLLDMTLPTFDISVDEDGGRPRAYAGAEFLKQLDRRKIRTPVLVITGFDKFGEGVDAIRLPELDAQLRASHAHTYIGAIYYSTSDEAWKEDLARRLVQVGDVRNA
jgi:DNA-binding NarL/FixJ family response regulator